MYYKDFSKSPSIDKKIKLTSEQEDKIINYYKNTNTKKSKDSVDLAIVGVIKIKFSNGDQISIDDNNDSYEYYKRSGYIIRISKEFKDYLLNLIDDL